MYRRTDPFDTGSVKGLPNICMTVCNMLNISYKVHWRFSPQLLRQNCVTVLRRGFLFKRKSHTCYTLFYGLIFLELFCLNTFLKIWIKYSFQQTSFCMQADLHVHGVVGLEMMFGSCHSWTPQIVLRRNTVTDMYVESCLRVTRVQKYAENSV